MDDKLDELYGLFWALVNLKMETHDPLEIASILVVQGLTLYKTVLDPEDFEKMVDSISNHRDNVKTIGGSLL